jgi:hypothetical protein
MTPSELKSEILNGPLAVELLPYWNSGADSDIVRILNRPDLPGYIPPIPLEKYLADQGLISVFTLIHDHLLLPCPTNQVPTTAPVFGLYALCSRLLTALAKGFRASVTEISSGCDVMVSASIMTVQQKTDVLALEVKISRIQTLYDLDVSVSTIDIAKARGA